MVEAEITEEQHRHRQSFTMTHCASSGAIGQRSCQLWHAQRRNCNDTVQCVMMLLLVPSTLGYNGE